jgi:DNA polymerase I-like protein with 3'-5' exonuclease and polymerase domains
MQEFITSPDPEIYFSDNYVVMDFETDTSHGDYGHPVHPDNKLILACYSRPGDRMRAHWGGEYQQEELLDWISDADFIVAHNSKYELGWLRRAGLDLRTVLPFCTKIAEYVLCGNRAAADDKQGLRPISTSLGACCKRRGLPEKDPVTDLLITGDVNPIYIPRPWLQGRCVRDVATAEDIFLDQRTVLRETERLPVAFTRNILTPFLAEMEFAGMCLDPAAVEEQHEQHMRERGKLETEFDDLTGGINWNSPKQVSKYVYEDLGFDELRDKRGQPKRNKATPRNPEGTRLTDKDSLALLVAKTAKQKHFVTLKSALSKVANALSKNLDYFQGVCKEQGGICHFVFNQTKTATHRLSSSGIATFFKLFNALKTAQGQNIPRAFKKLFKARKKGWLMGEADGASLEFRCAGILTDDRQVRHDVVGHHDVHRFSASVLNSIEADDVTKAQRQAAKSDTFKPLYGGKSGTKEQMRYYAAFRERYSAVADAQEQWVETVAQDKVLRTRWGMRYYWPTARRSRTGYVNVSTSVCNYPVQAFATAEIIPVAVVYFWHRLGDHKDKDKILPVNTIHDSIICEVHPKAQETFKELAMVSFTSDVYEYLRAVYNFDVGPSGIPLGVGISLGSHWSTGEEEAWNVFADGRREQYE